VTAGHACGVGARRAPGPGVAPRPGSRAASPGCRPARSGVSTTGVGTDRLVRPGAAVGGSLAELAGRPRSSPVATSRAAACGFAWTRKVKSLRPTERFNVSSTASALSCGPWTKKGWPSRPKLMALGTAHDPSWSVVAAKPRGGLEPKAPRVLDRAEHQVLGQLRRCLERSGLVGGEERATEVGRAALVHDAWADHVLDPQAVDVDQPAAQAHPAVALLARDQHADQAQGFGVGGVDIGPTGMTLDGEPRLHPGLTQQPASLRSDTPAWASAAMVLTRGDHLCGPQAKGTGNLLWSAAGRAQRAHPVQQLLARPCRHRSWPWLELSKHARCVPSAGAAQERRRCGPGIG
jgi:hypothetical protein